MRPACFVGLFTCVGGWLLAGPAAAQQPAPSPPTQGAPAPGGKSPQFNLRREGPSAADAQTARARARAGDCAGALAAFDAALRTAADPSLNRDRGLCHEKVGNPFPAMDDYRIYVTARPDAPDTDDIRQRLAALEQQTGTGGARPGTGAENTTTDAPAAHASGSVEVGVQGGRATASTSSSSALGPKSGDSGRGYDYYVQQEKLADSAEASPLRNGSGVVLGPILHLPRFFVGEKAPTDLAYGVALALRYATGATLTLISEIGYAGVGASGAATSRSGPLLMAGVELRFPISRFAGDHLLLRGGAGFERYVVSGSRAVNSNVLGRFAFGYRHVFGPSLGLELLADGGPAFVIPENGDGRLNGVIGASVAFVVGF